MVAMATTTSIRDVSLGELHRRLALAVDTYQWLDKLPAPECIEAAERYALLAADLAVELIRRERATAGFTPYGAARG